jgi:UDP-2,3-diacylglucosamine hydrolase
VRGAHEIAPELVAAEGVLGRHRPGKRDHADIALAMKVAYRLGELDVGQGAVVSRGYVLAVEAAEGTDRMLARCGELRQWGRARSGRRMGVLVKRPRPGQEIRLDMPAIGPATIDRAAEAGLAGIGVMAGKVLLVDRSKLIEQADAAGLFVIGVNAGD